MKTTYLINKKQPDGNVRLTVASSAEWLAVVNANKQLPPEQRRYFILDYIADRNNLDRMVIETSADDYYVWHRDHMAAERNRAAGGRFQHLSLDMLLFNNDETACLLDTVLSDVSVEDMVSDRMLMAGLREKLTEWRPWANDLLELYLQGRKRDCTAVLAAKYGVSPQTARKYKRQFEKFVKTFLEGVSF